MALLWSPLLIIVLLSFSRFLIQINLVAPVTFILSFLFRMSNIIPINAADSELKEQLLVRFYYGGVNVHPKEFIQRELDTKLIDRLSSTDELTLDSAKSAVLNYLANYVSWVDMARAYFKHTEEAVNILLL